MNSEDDLPCGRGCPIRTSRDRRSLASPPGFSQRATSFIASQCQGIHQMPFILRLILLHAAAHRGKTPFPRSGDGAPASLSLHEAGAGTHTPGTPAASHEDTSSDRHSGAPPRPRADPPRSHDNSLFTLQSTAPPHNKNPIGLPEGRRTIPRFHRTSHATGADRWWR
jgi:hypothetical protein